ncbi:MAG: SUMF1/EgtB/PvdO family nonheme iron enzyme [Muribaculaceae bacterium]|nr:SUMF1/EgtB/PvdO family nonheme iron enzyme [Muribaculaceae bacterium]
MKKIIAFILTLIPLCTISAQELFVCDFKHVPDDVSAAIYQVKDANGDPCALIKVGTTATNPSFEGNIVTSEDKGGEYWVYVTAETFYLTIKSDNYLPVKYEFEPVQANNTYEMRLCEDKPLEPIMKIELEPRGGLKGQKKMPVKFNMILVKNGMFKMGTPKEQGGDDDERPVHWVTISKDFYMGETEVTQELWEYVMYENPSASIDPQKPVESITWVECQEFIKRLNSITGYNFRLPTEAEWEYAAKGGNNSKKTRYSGSNNPEDVAWYYKNCNSTQIVKTKKPNELGLYDMSGNVWEFCFDNKGNYDKEDVTDPVCANSSKNRVRRGGSWESEKVDQLRTGFRRRAEQDVALKNVGFRLVMDVPSK